MDVVEKRRPLDGRIKTRNPAGEEVEMRLSTLPTAFGEKDGDAHLRPRHRGQGFVDALGFTRTTPSAGRTWSSSRTASSW